MDGPDRMSAEAISERIDQMPLAPWHGRLLAILGGAHFFDAFDATAISFVLPVLVGLWHLTSIQAGLLLAASYAGQMAGSIGAGMIAERHGRMSVLRAGIAIMSLLSLACAFAPSYAVLLALRIIQGLGLGGEMPIAATYLNETAPARFRGRMVTAIQLLFGTGAFIASVMARFLIPHFGWSSMFLMGSVPILLAAMLRRLLPESPRWLAARGRKTEAEAAVSSIERAVYARRPVPTPLPSARETGMPGALPANTLPSGGMRTILTQPFLGPTMSAWLIAFFASLVGYGIIGWLPTIYRTVYHLPIATALSYSITTGAMSLVGAVFCLLVIDRLGRKLSLFLGFSGAALSLGFLAIQGAATSAFEVMVLASIALMFLALPLAGIYVYTPELYPTHVRALGVGVALAWLRVASIVGPPAIGAILAAGSVGGVYAFLALGALLGAAATAVLGVETDGRRKRTTCGSWEAQTVSSSEQAAHR